MNVTDAKTFLETNLPDYLGFLKQLVDVNSFTSNPAGINANGELVIEQFASLGFAAEAIQSVNPAYGKHVVLTRQGTGSQTIGLVSHLDTVYPPEEEIANDFHWREEGNRIYGPGTVDIKGGTVVIYMVLDALRQFAPELFEATTWIVLMNASEEVINYDFGDLCVDKLGKTASACLVFEGGLTDAGTFKFVVARKGMATYKLTVSGNGAHAGVAHEKGANAIVELARAVDKISGFTNYDDQITFNVGVIEGGTVINRVPHFAQAKVEMRAFDEAIYADGVSKMLALADETSVKSVASGYPCDLKVEVMLRVRPWSRNEATDGLFDHWQAAAREVGYDAIREERGGLSDGNLVWHTVPTLDALGPSGANSHCSERTPDGSKDQEYVDRTTFVPKALVNAFALYRLLTNADRD